MRCQLTSLFMAVLLMSTACSDGIVDSGDTADDNRWDTFGVPTKSDDPRCSTDSILCWDQGDAERFRAILRLEDDLLAGRGVPANTAQEITAILDGLRHKLKPDQTAELDEWARLAMDVQHEDDALVWLATIREGAIAHLSEGYFAAHSVSLGQLSVAEDKFDRFESESPAGSEAGLNANMVESLRLLKDSGAVGLANAFLLQHTGVLDMPYPPENERFPFSEPIEDRVDRAIEEARWASIRLGTIVGLESLVPFVGLATSIPHGFIGNFRIRARLILEIASLYGIDVREGYNLLLVSQVLIQSSQEVDVLALMSTSLALPAVASSFARITGSALPKAVLKSLTLKGLSHALGMLRLKGEQVMARAAAKAATRGAGRQVLGYATLGVAIIADIALNTSATGRMGNYGQVLMTPWGTNSFRSGAGFLLSPKEGECVAEMMGWLAGRDTVVSEIEIQFLAAHVSRMVYDGYAWQYISQQQRNQWIHHIGRGSGPECLLAEDVYFNVGARRNIYAWLLTIAALDGEITASEEEALESVVEAFAQDRRRLNEQSLKESEITVIRERIQTILVDTTFIAEFMDAVEDHGDHESSESLRLNRTWFVELETADERVVYAVRCALNMCIQ